MPSVFDQIAKELGVSSATVSRALNDRPGVSAALREQIQAKARELQYMPTLAARGLATSQTFSIGFFIHEKPGLPAHSDPFYAEILRSAEQVAARTDYHLTIATLTDDILAKPSNFRFVRERRIDAMILAGPDIPTSFIHTMLQTGLPVILVDNRLDFTPVNCVNSNDEDGAYEAAKYLIKQGHTCIGILAGPQTWVSNARRVKGYRLALSEAGIQPFTVYVDQTSIESGEMAYRQLLAHQAGITAVCAVNDSMAIGAIRAAKSEGKRVPEDLSVIGFDDIAWAALNDPPLSTVRIPRQQMGKEAAYRLLMLLNDPELLPSEIIVPVQWVERASTAHAPT